MNQQIGQYRILGELGAGGMGVVYRALDLELQREVALKRLRSEFAASPAILDRFRNEAKLQGRLNHPNIAQLYSVAQTPDAFCLVMEFVDGVMVKDLLPLHWEDAISILLQVLDALGYAHSLGVLHRDIKPENILIDRRGTVKVMDFGIAYAIGSQRMTREKSLIGTLEYMSPERILGKPMDGRSDIYALGILFYELLCGKLPFDIPNEYDLLRWQLDERAPHITSVVNVPVVLDEVIQRAMHKSPDDRYSTCSEMAAQLRACVPALSGSRDSLQELVANHQRSQRSGAFDQTECYRRVALSIRAGDLASAENTLRNERNSHPREDSLRQYHTLVAWAGSQSDQIKGATDGPATDPMQMTWLRMIAAKRNSDRDTYADQLEQMIGQFPQTAIAQLLQAQSKEA
jgi:serine/threonine protein kinase